MDASCEHCGCTCDHCGECDICAPRPTLYIEGINAADIAGPFTPIACYEIEGGEQYFAIE